MNNIEKDTILRQREVWERRRRNPKYLAICDQIDFDQNGYYIEINQPILEGSINLVPFPSPSGLILLIRPDKEFDEILKEMPIQKDSCKFGIHFRGSYENAVCPKTNIPEDGSSFNYHAFLQDGRFVNFEIDLSQNNQDIQSELFGYIKTFRNIYRIKTQKGGKTFEKRLQYYEIWDLRKGKKSFEEIALAHKKNREELLEKATNRVKKQFYKAFELIMDYQYDPEKFKVLRSTIKKSELKIPCKKCPDSKCREEMENNDPFCVPCPDYLKAIEPYISQDEVKPFR